MLGISCAECGGTVYLDLSERIELLTSFGIGNKSAKVGMGNLKFKS